ncbi:double-CXXCG motif protein [Myxococcaceae bacterium GXIMD 01537]
MTFFSLKAVEPSQLRFTGEYRATHRWKLPGVHCPLCQATWSMTGAEYPCVDLSELSSHARYEEARLEEDYSEFERLREAVRPLAPAGVTLWPGTRFGPLRGSALGSFGQLVMQYGWALLMRREALEQLQAEGVRGLMGCRAELRFRQKNAPVLMELQVEPGGLLHRDCLPSDLPPPCSKCGRQGFTRPEQPLLDASSLPADRDLFRLSNFSTMLVASSRFVDTVRRLGFEEVSFVELPVR